MTKVVIGVCDDKQEVVEQLSNHITMVMSELRVSDWTLKQYISPLELLNDAEDIDVLFLDIEMPEMDGVEVGKKIKKINTDCTLIMATSREERYKEAFLIEAFRFVTKPFCIDEIKEALKSILNRKIGKNEIEVFWERKKFMIKERDITMVRAYNGYVEILVGASIFRKDVSLDCLEQQLDERLFFRISRKYLINFANVERYDNSSVVVCGEKLNIAIRRRKDFKNKYINYDLEYRWR